MQTKLSCVCIETFEQADWAAERRNAVRETTTHHCAQIIQYQHTKTCDTVHRYVYTLVTGTSAMYFLFIRTSNTYSKLAKYLNQCGLLYALQKSEQMHIIQCAFM